MEMEYSGMEYNPFKDGDELSATIVKKLTNDVKYSYKDDKNYVRIVFK